MDTPEISYETFLNLIRQLDDLVAVFENHPDPATREQAIALLTGLDMLHHEGLGRLVAALRITGGGEPLDRVVQKDPVVRTLLGLYGLADLGLADEPEGSVAFVPLERLTMKGKPLDTRDSRSRE